MNQASPQAPDIWPQLPRIGLGTDLHRLEAGRACILGGILFADCPVGPRGHSDGDAILHALCDALLGAAGLDDLGSLFPDDADENKNRNSQDFIHEALRLLEERKLRPISVDLVVHCDRPKIAPQRSKIRSKLASLLGLPSERINLKGKTLEGTSQGPESISVQAIALLAHS